MTPRFQLWYSLADLADMFGFSRTTIRAWWSDGRFGPVSECIKVAEDIRVPEAGVLFFIESNRVVRTQESVDQGRQLMRERLERRAQHVEQRRVPETVVTARTQGEVRRKVAAGSFRVENSEVNHG
jgi:transcriptional regulator with XRE-family HTH domain